MQRFVSILGVAWRLNNKEKEVGIVTTELYTLFICFLSFALLNSVNVIIFIERNYSKLLWQMNSMICTNIAREPASRAMALTAFLSIPADNLCGTKFAKRGWMTSSDLSLF